MKPDDPLLPGAAEAAASVRFQPAAEDVHVCPACYHPPHAGMCVLCLCYRVVPASHADAREDAQAVDAPVDEWEPDPSRGRHRREVPQESLLQRLRGWLFGR